MTNPDAPIPYTLAHVWCCECEDCLNPVPYKLTGAGKTYPTGEVPGSVVREVQRAKERMWNKAKAARKRARRAG